MNFQRQGVSQWIYTMMVLIPIHLLFLMNQATFRKLTIMYQHWLLKVFVMTPPTFPGFIYGIQMILAIIMEIRKNTLNRSGWLTSRSGVSGRSEEHTSELQSRGHLVCRLLLD